MKNSTLLSGTAVLLMLILWSCRETNEQVMPSPTDESQIITNTRVVEPDPPKDDPKDYDDWRSLRRIK